MDHSLPSKKIYVAQSKIANAGRGVFTNKDIKKGEVIERCPTLKIPAYEADSLNKTMLVEYVYYLGRDKDQLTLCLGYGSIYNHTYKPNAFYKEKEDENVLEFIALQDIKIDEEITVNYNQQNGNDQKPLWFEVS